MTMSDLNPTDLLELAARVEGGEGEDRELDELVRAWEVGATIEWQEHKKANAYHRDGSWVSIGPVEPFTSSLDAVTALLERVLPGWEWQANGKKANHTSCLAWVHSGSQHDKLHKGSAPTPARALLSSLLRALATLEPKG